jgi:glyoxylase-like metal-dependent hydrolase (beta-lactamase superfamily II)
MQTAAPLMIGDARLDRVTDLERFDLPLMTLFPAAEPAALHGHRHWLEPQFMRGDDVALSMHSIVLRIDGRVILIDTCVGEHKPRPRQQAWHQRHETSYIARLAAIGLRPENVDVVFCTHLHADHIGWNTRLVDGRWVPTFPRAHWQQTIQLNPVINHGSYADSVLPVVEAGRADLVDADHEIHAGLVVRALPGHSPGQIGISMQRGDARGIFCGDAVHHPVQLVRPDWSSRFCADPDQARATRRTLLEDAADRGAWLVPAHFMGLTGMRIRRTADIFLPLAM